MRERARAVRGLERTRFSIRVARVRIRVSIPRRIAAAAAAAAADSRTPYFRLSPAGPRECSPTASSPRPLTALRLHTARCCRCSRSQPAPSPRGTDTKRRNGRRHERRGRARREFARRESCGGRYGECVGARGRENDDLRTCREAKLSFSSLSVVAFHLRERPRKRASGFGDSFEAEPAHRRMGVGSVKRGDSSNGSRCCAANENMATATRWVAGELGERAHRRRRREGHRLPRRLRLAHLIRGHLL